MTKKESTEVADVKNTALVVPDYLKQTGKARGSEEVGADDIQIPRIEVAQALSPQIDKTKPEYIPGLEQGNLYNTLTGEILPMPLSIIPVYFRKRFLAWKDRKKGGGLRGMFETLEEAEQGIAGLEDFADIEIQETGEHFVIYGFENGGAIEAMISMSRTKLKVSRKFNSLVRMKGGDRFAWVYLLMTGKEQNGANQDYWNINVAENKEKPFPSEAAYRYATGLYESIISGRRNIVGSYTGAQDEVTDSASSAADDSEI